MRSLAERLRTDDGVDVTLDRWAVAAGDELPRFMEAAVRDNDFVLLVCTPTYRRKFEERLGGVGYEARLIAGKISLRADARRFIPLHRSGTRQDAVPLLLGGAFSVNLEGDPYDESNYRHLVEVLHGRRPLPPLLKVQVLTGAEVRYEGPGATHARPFARFTGRDEDLAELVAHLLSSEETAVCVVASGVGGMGKTVLAQQLVATVAPRLFPDGAAWLDGAELASELPKVVRRFGWAKEQDPLPAEAARWLERQLHDREILLVVDNVNPGAVDLAHLPFPGGRCRTLLTSRAT